MTERETLLAEIAEKQARLAELDAEPDYEAWKPLVREIISMYHTTRLADADVAAHILGKPSVRALIAAFAKAPPMGSIEPVVSRGIGLSGKVEEVIVDGVRYVLPTRADFEALEAMQEAREALLNIRSTVQIYSSGYALDVYKCANAAIARIDGEQP
jgi:hypothetical protein